MGNRDWSQEEIEATVESYLRMLKKELAGEPYVKVHENARVRVSLNNRTKAAVEYKYQNISAVLERLGRLRVKGYLPAQNTQQALCKAVVSALEADRELDHSSLLIAPQ